MCKWRYSVSTAEEAPISAPILLQGSVSENLERAAKLGYDAIELHTREDVCLDYEDIARRVEETGTCVAMILTGRLYTQGRCDLIDDRPYIVGAAMDGMRRYIEIAGRLGADVVIGWAKGRIPESGNPKQYLDRLAKNLRILATYASEYGVKLNIEVINRYEVNFFTTAREVIEFIEEYKLDNCFVHLDTFHMYIDEPDPLAAIRACKSKLGYVHLADNSRRYPGSGSIDFQKILQILDEIEYKGYLSVECFPVPSGEEAAAMAIEHMKKCERHLRRE